MGESEVGGDGVVGPLDSKASDPLPVDARSHSAPHPGKRDSIGVHHEVVTFRELRLDGVVRRVFPYTEGVAVDLEFGDLALWSIAVSSCLN